MSATLIIKDGGNIHGIWDEIIDLTKLGKLSIERLTRIEFNERDQEWRVLQNRPDDAEDCLYASKSRDECLKWEEENAVMLIERKLRTTGKQWACNNLKCENNDIYPENFFSEIGADPRCKTCGLPLMLADLMEKE